MNVLHIAGAKIYENINDIKSFFFKHKMKEQKKKIRKPNESVRKGIESGSSLTRGLIQIREI